MCYNCGCEDPDNDMGKGNAGVETNGKSITNKSFLAAGISQHMDDSETKRNVYVLLQKLLKE